MVSIVPNQYQIRGTILRKRKDPDYEDHYLVDLHLDFVKVIKGPREFLDKKTEMISVSVPKNMAAGIEAGNELKCMVKRTRYNFIMLEDSISF